MSTCADGDLYGRGPSYLLAYVSCRTHSAHSPKLHLSTEQCVYVQVENYVVGVSCGMNMVHSWSTDQCVTVQVEKYVMGAPCVIYTVHSLSTDQCVTVQVENYVVGSRLHLSTEQSVHMCRWRTMWWEPPVG